MLNFSIKKLSSTALVLSCFAILSSQPVVAMEENDEDLRLALRLSEEQFKEEEKLRLQQSKSFEETHRIEEEKLRLQEERELKEAMQKPLESSNKNKIVEEKKEVLTEEMWQKLGACALPDNFGDTYLQMANLSHLSTDSFEGKEALLNQGWILTKDLNNEYFYNFIMEKKKINKPIEVITINQNQMIKKAEIVEEVNENKEKIEFVKFSQNVFTQEIFPQFEQEMKGDHKGTESSMQVVYAFENKRGMFDNLKKIFEKIHGPLTLKFMDAQSKIFSIQELVKKQKGNKFSSYEKLKQWSEYKDNWRPFMGESLQMFVQASHNDDSLSELVEEQGEKCVTGLNGRVLMQLTLLLMNQVEKVEKGEMNLFGEKK